jgi:hypothetical protein
MACQVEQGGQHRKKMGVGRADEGWLQLASESFIFNQGLSLLGGKRKIINCAWRRALAVTATPRRQPVALALPSAFNTSLHGAPRLTK